MDLRDYHIRNSKNTNGDSVSKGDIVILHEDQKRNNWKLAKVDKLIESTDGKLRGARLLISHDTKNVYINRPVNKLTKLELNKEDDDESTTEEPAIKFIDDKYITSI